MWKKPYSQWREICFCDRKFCPVKGKIILQQEVSSCDREFPPVTENFFLFCSKLRLRVKGFLPRFLAPWLPKSHIQNQVPTKCISSGKFFCMIHAMMQIDWASLPKEREFFLLELISCDKHWFPVTSIDFLWQALISCDKKTFQQWLLSFKIKNIFIVTKYIVVVNKHYLFSYHK